LFAQMTSFHLYTLGFVALVLILIMFVYMAISAYVAWKLAHPNRLLHHVLPEEYGLTYETISFLSRDRKVQLKGWFLSTESTHPKMTIIFSHGYRGNRLESNLPALSLAKSLVDHGYNVMMYDFRNCGESEGHITSVGLLEKQDLLGAIDWVKKHHSEPVGLIGFSMGAATSLITAAEAPEVLGVVSDSSFSQLNEYLSDNLSVWSRLPKFPFTRLILFNFKIMLGINPSQVNPLLAVDQIYPRPILFIHGDQDQAIPHLNSVLMQQKHPDSFELWTAADVGHVEAYAAYKEEYTQRVIDFFDRLVKVR
jgi:pimeloyl-ACP methyl ester carboxylesterase